jgi:hypothetical protein
MEPLEPKKGIPFRSFLEKSVNLMVVFGILNSLYIFSTTITENGLYQYFAIPFLALSIFVWVEIILLARESTNNTWRYELFMALSMAVGVGLVFLLFIRFSLALRVVLFLVVLIAITYYISKLVDLLFGRMFPKVRNKRPQAFLFWAIIISIAVLFAIFTIGRPYVTPTLTKFFSDSTQSHKSQ